MSALLLTAGLVFPVCVLWFIGCYELDQRVVKPWIARRIERGSEPHEEGDA